MIHEHELDYEHHLDAFRKLLNGDSRNDSHFHRSAETSHILSVIDAVLDLHFRIMTVGNNCTKEQVKFHLHYGAGRRSKFLWLTLREVLEILPPERKTPLLADEVEKSALALNSAYINMRGLLDNFAWAAAEACCTEDVREKLRRSPQLVNLFHPEFQKIERLREISVVVNEFDKWNQELKSRRDPAAHRIPLSILPAVLDDNDQKLREQLLGEWREACNAACAAVHDRESSELFRKASKLLDEIARVGSFDPLLIHNPSDGVIRVYPTVPQDVGQLVKFSRKLIGAIETQQEKAHATENK